MKGWLCMSRSRQKTSKKKTARKKSKTPLIVFSLAGATMLVLSLFLALKNPTPAAGSQDSSNGTPVLQVDKQQVDLGDVPLGTYVEASFQLTNTGTQTLKFTGKPYIEVVEGC
jgi:flagellar basal body-associated protein FliL